MQEQIITHYLDMNRQYQLKMTVVPREGNKFEVEAELVCPPYIKPELKENLTQLLRVSKNRQSFLSFREDDGKIKGKAEFSSTAKGDGHLSITLNGKAIGGYDVDGDTLKPMEHNDRYALTASSMRMLSFYMTDEQKKLLPYPTDGLGELDESCLPKTDLHTHLSSQLSGESMLEMAKEKGIAYPIELLHELDIEYGGLDQLDISPFRFDPMINADRALTCEMMDPADYEKYQSDLRAHRDDLGRGGDTVPEPKLPKGFNQSMLKGIDLNELEDKNPEGYQTLLRAMSIPQDRVFGPNDFDETFYRFRNPLEKNEDLAEEKILQVARVYKEQGIEYAELSTGAMLKPEWLKEAIPAIKKAEEETGVKLRLLVGIPRTSSPEKVAATIERIKFLGQLPYIVGADFLGFESNKTEDFNWALYNLARWSRRLRNGIKESDEFMDYRDEFALRVHAGENNENVDNVEGAIKIAKHFGVPMRIGHAVHGYVNKALAEMAKEARVIMEFIPASNIALNNVPYLQKIPIKKWVDHGVNCVLGSDGEGAYQTNNRQLATDAHHAGLDIKDLKRMRDDETRYIGDMDKRFNDKKTPFEKKYESDDIFVEEYKAYSDRIDSYVNKENGNDLPERFGNKTPILIAGASGTSWKEIAPEHQAEISTAMRMMVEMLDPEKVYFATGRVKDRGVEKELDHAIDEYDNHNWNEERPFDMIATYAAKGSDAKIANGVTWINTVDKEPDAIAPDVIKFMKDHAHKPNGKAGAYALFVGGKVLTSEFIRQAQIQELAHGLMKGPEGRSNEESERSKPEYVIKNGGELSLAEATLQHLVENLGIEIFKQEYRDKMKNNKAIKSTIHEVYETQSEKVLEAQKMEDDKKPEYGHPDVRVHVSLADVVGNMLSSEEANRVIAEVNAPPR